MQMTAEGRTTPALKQLVTEASRALAQLDADRLEELALSCEALNRELTPVALGADETLSTEARMLGPDLAVLARVLEVTQANLEVMRQVREMRSQRLEYSPSLVRPWTGTESSHGDN